MRDRVQRNKLTQQHLIRHPEKILRFNKVNIWSNEWNSWWRPKASGYTDDIDRAGIWDAQEAFAKVSHCGAEKGIVLYAARAIEPENKE